MKRALFSLFFGLICLSAHGASLSARIVDKDGKPMSDAVVYAVPAVGKAPTTSAAPTALVVQEDMEFKPYVSVVQTGTLVSFQNKDKHEHHIKSYGPAKEFEFKITDASRLPPVLFDKLGNSVVVCYLHGWMRAHILTVDTAYFAVSDKDGNAKILALPDGDYELRAWHPDTLAAPLTFKVKVSDSATPVDIKFDHLPRKRRSKPSAPSVS